MKTDKNSKFLVKYGPDKFRDEELASHSGSNRSIANLISSPLISDDHINAIVQKNPYYVHRIASHKTHPSDEFVSKYLSDETPNPESYSSKSWHLLQNDDLQPQHLKQAIDHKSFKRDDVSLVMLHKNFNSDVLGHIIKKPDYHTNITFQFSNNDRDYTKKHVTDDHLQTMADDLNDRDKSHHIRGLMQGIGFKYGEKDARDAEIDKIPTKLMDSLISSKNMYAKEQATNFQASLQPHHIKALLNDDDTFLIGRGVSAPRISDYDLLRHAKHDDPLVRQRAKQHIRKRFGEYKLKELGIDS